MLNYEGSSLTDDGKKGGKRHSVERKTDGPWRLARKD